MIEVNEIALHKKTILLTVLPRERRARHPYQLCTMLALIVVSVLQLLAPPPQSWIMDLPIGAQTQLNWFAIVAGLTGLLAAVIPERMVSIFGHDFDATWMRLWIEFACHGLLVTVWFSYFWVIIGQSGERINWRLVAVLVAALGVAALWRCVQIAWTVKRAVFDPEIDSAVIGSGDISGQTKGG